MAAAAKPSDDKKDSHPKTHVVKEGESITDVADILGITVEQVRQRNNLRHDLLYHGQKLTR